MSDVVVTGVPELLRKFEAMTRELQQNAVITAIKFGGDIFAEAVRNNANKGPYSGREQLASAAPSARRTFLKRKKSRKLAMRLGESVRVSSYKNGRKSWTAGPLVEVRARRYYGKFVEFGTGRHLIKARNVGGVLKFLGVTVYSAEHPGNRPRPFMRPAFDEREEMVRDEIARRLRNSIMYTVARR